MIKLIGISGKICSGKTTISEALIEKFGYKRMVLAEPLKDIARWYIRYLSLIEEFKGNPGELQKVLDRHIIELDSKLRDMVSGKSTGIVEIVTRAHMIKNVLFEKVFPKFKNADWSVEKNNDIRLFYQQIGETLRQEFGDDIWVKAMLNRIRRTHEEEDIEYFICDDVRQKSEYVRMKEFGFKIVRLTVDPQTQMERIFKLYGQIDPQRLKHISETDLDDVNDFDLVVTSYDSIEKTLQPIIQYIEKNR